MFLCEQNDVLIRERFGAECALYGTRTDEQVKCDVFYTYRKRKIQVSGLYRTCGKYRRIQLWWH